MVFFGIVSSGSALTKQFSPATKPFSPATAMSGNVGWLSKSQRSGRQCRPPGDRQMRTISFILAFAFILVGPSVAGTSDSSLPGIGTFSYNGASVIVAPPAMVIAAR
jgi:hypothetical protein